MRDKSNKLFSCAGNEKGTPRLEVFLTWATYKIFSAQSILDSKKSSINSRIAIRFCFFSAETIHAVSKGGR